MLQNQGEISSFGRDEKKELNKIKDPEFSNHDLLFHIVISSKATQS